MSDERPPKCPNTHDTPNAMEQNEMAWVQIKAYLNSIEPDPNPNQLDHSKHWIAVWLVVARLIHAAAAALTTTNSEMAGSQTK